jgi:hypothetical protein
MRAPPAFALAAARAVVDAFIDTFIDAFIDRPKRAAGWRPFC